MKRIILAFVACFCVLTALVFVVATVWNAPVRYVALGDSISSGYALEDPATQAFPALLAAEDETELTNLAVAGTTSDGLLEMLDDEAVIEAVRDADVITITIGGNDLMDALYAYLAESTGRTTDEMRNLLSGEGGALSLLTLARLVVATPDFPESQQLKQALSTYAGNLDQILTRIATLNDGATVIVVTQYQPYRHLTGTPAIGGLLDACESGVTSLNAQIKSVAEKTGVRIADVYTAFESDNTADVPLCNATLLPNINLDFHPNSEGHRLIAEIFSAVIHNSNG